MLVERGKKKKKKTQMWYLPQCLNQQKVFGCSKNCRDERIDLLLIESWCCIYGPLDLGYFLLFSGFGLSNIHFFS